MEMRLGVEVVSCMMILYVADYKCVYSNAAAIIRSMLHCRVMRQMLRIVQIVFLM